MPYDPERHGPQRVVGPGFHAQVWDVVRSIPAGRVATYGDVAEALGARSVARQVGWALASLPDGSDVPWHRVVSGAGVVARAGNASGREQIRRLRDEGVAVDDAGRIRGFRVVRSVDLEPRSSVRASERTRIRTPASARRRSTR